MTRFPRRLVRWAFTQLYGPLAPLYDTISRVFFLDQWRLWQQAPLGEVVGSVLEVGAGTGTLAHAARQRGLRWTALEQSAAMIRQARRKYPTNLPPLVRGEAQALPFANEAFDHVVSTFPTEYIFDPQALAELGRVLRPGGTLLVVPAAEVRPAGMAGSLLDRFHQVVYGDSPRITELPGPNGVQWTAKWVASPHGRAILLQGIKPVNRAKTALESG